MEVFLFQTWYHILNRSGPKFSIISYGTSRVQYLTSSSIVEHEFDILKYLPYTILKYLSYTICPQYIELNHLSKHVMR